MEGGCRANDIMWRCKVQFVTFNLEELVSVYL